jgi:hypothetical protein
LPKLTKTDRRVLKLLKARLAEEKLGDKWSRRDDTEPELLDDFATLWKEGSAFYLTGVVSSPYSGCFHEPNIWLVTPPGCDEHDSINSNNDSEREQCIWPLYASGQGIKTGEETAGHRAFIRVLFWLADQQLCSTYGTFDSFSVSEMCSISDLAPTEHYWAAAIAVAEDEYQISLTWTCGCCDSEQQGRGESYGPHFTSYRGNGGVGVFMEGAICDECLYQGSCPACSARGCTEDERWDQWIYDGKRFLCEWCEESLFDDCVALTTAGEAAVDNADCVSLRWGVRDPTQITLPGIEAPLEMLIELSVGSEEERKTQLLSPADYSIDLESFWDSWEKVLGYDASDMRSHLEYGLPFPDLSKHADEIDEEAA